MNEADRGEGWLLFAGILVLVAGVLNTIWGIAAIDSANFFLEDDRYIFEDLNTMGWFVLVIGVVQLFAAFSIWAGGQFGRWVGMIAASVNAVFALLSIPGYPLWSIAVFGIDLLIIYGLAAYGGLGRRSTTTGS
jgi:uncharacterized membrane protein (DUF2068 family)